MVIIKIRALPDALVKVYNEDTDEIVYLDNTNEDGETPPITLESANYYLDVTQFT